MTKPTAEPAKSGQRHTDSNGSVWEVGWDFNWYLIEENGLPVGDPVHVEAK
ncbi:hypothetical protein C8K36_102477 [Rhodococcus sp. OK519]|uniref:hypothetical protein n=1 Tax=Rhodococcus sp. OK519 TaxID=2135729 RepID=UPI000D4C5E10|nr:hypothetical protein C8K36_102477 [Rhodococcus sp. OK519]